MAGCCFLICSEIIRLPDIPEMICRILNEQHVMPTGKKWLGAALNKDSDRSIHIFAGSNPYVIALPVE